MDIQLQPSKILRAQINYFYQLHKKYQNPITLYDQVIKIFLLSIDKKKMKQKNLALPFYVFIISPVLARKFLVIPNLHIPSFYPKTSPLH